MMRAELTEKILSIKRIQRLSWKQIAEKVGGASPILVTAALLGQMRLDKAQAERASALLGLDASRKEAAKQLQAALEAIGPFQDAANRLTLLARFVVERQA